MCVNQDKYLVRWGSRTEIIRANRTNKTEKDCYVYLRRRRSFRSCSTRVDDAETYTGATDLAASCADCVGGAPRPQRWELPGAAWELGSDEELNSELAARSS
jgi:hypothetical protein